MSVKSVSGAQGSVPAQTIQGIREENGKMVVTFGGKKYTLTKKQAEQYNEVLYNVNYVRNRIDALKTKLADKTLDAEDKQTYSAELKDLQEKYAKQQEYANFEISPTGGTVAFTLKKDIPAELLKEVFYIKDGAFREHLKEEALRDGIGQEKNVVNSENLPYASYDEAMMSGISNFSNGVYLEYTDDAGHYQPVYSRAILYDGMTYTISSSEIDPYKDAPFYTRWFGIGKDD